MKAYKTLQHIYRTAAFLLAVILFCFPGYIMGDNLVSNVDGKIRVLILHYGNGSYYRGFWFEQTILYRDLLEKMDRDVGLVILLGKDNNADRVKAELKPYEAQRLPDGTPRVKYLTVNVKTRQFYPWARDGYMILAGENNRLIFLDAGFNDKPFPIANFHEVFEGAVTRSGVIHRGGGNIRTTNEEIFVGMDTLLGINIKPRWSHFSLGGYDHLYALTKDLTPENLPAFKQTFDTYARFIHYNLAPGKKMVIPGKDIFFSKLEKGEFKFTAKAVWHTGAQAAYHTDVYLGLGHIDENGKRILFIADSRAGAEIAKKLPAAQRRKIEAQIPHLLVKEKFTAAGIEVSAEQIAQRFQWEKHKLLDLCIKKSLKLADTLDNTAQHLAAMGYHIVRVPYLPNGLDNKNESNDDVIGVGFNYSNVLVEVYDNVKKVYLPQFGFKELDDAAAAAYQSVGFTPIIIDGLLTNSLTTGNAMAGLDCLTSDIRIPVRWAKKYYKK